MSVPRLAIERGWANDLGVVIDAFFPSADAVLATLQPAEYVRRYRAELLLLGQLAADAPDPARAAVAEPPPPAPPEIAGGPLLR